VSCGGFHTAVVTEDGKLYTFGGGEHGQLGHSDRVNKHKPTLVQALDGVFVSQITCGWSHSVALTVKGRVYTWGNSDHGKLGHGCSRKVSVPQLAEKLRDYRVVRVASYNEHTAALVEPFDHHSLGGGGGGHYGAGGMNSVSVSVAYTAQMRTLVNDEEFADVIFMVENEPIHAHMAILAQRSEHFVAMFRSGMRESTERIVHIPHISRTIFLLLLEYLYTDSVKIEVEHAVELYIAADLYNLDRLRDMCCFTIRRNLNPQNSGPLLETATEHHCQALKDICMKYVVENFDSVSKTDGIKNVSHSVLLEILAQR
jgi:RCC1 and BTB domain-containing protein